MMNCTQLFSLDIIREIFLAVNPHDILILITIFFQHIVTCIGSDYRQVLDWQLDLLGSNTQLVTTPYSSL
jgi:hypothetical protein